MRPAGARDRILSWSGAAARPPRGRPRARGAAQKARQRAGDALPGERPRQVAGPAAARKARRVADQRFDRRPPAVHVAAAGGQVEALHLVRQGIAGVQRAGSPAHR